MAIERDSIRGRRYGRRWGFAAAAMVCLLAGCSATGAGSREQAASGQTPTTRPGGAAATSSPPASASADKEGWVSLFDGQTLSGWRILEEGAFVGHAGVRAEDGAIVLERGRLQTGIGWEGEFPRDNYEVALEAKRTAGSDFFCGMTFTVGDEPCTLIVGGWGGMVVGLSNVNGASAVENETTTGMSFQTDQWYCIRLRVTPERIQAWIDDDEVISLERAGRHFSIWWEQERVKPFGIGTWDTGAALRAIKLRRLGDTPTP